MLALATSSAVQEYSAEIRNERRSSMYHRTSDEAPSPTGKEAPKSGSFLTFFEDSLA